jgi:hypothetical protein
MYYARQEECLAPALGWLSLYVSFMGRKRARRHEVSAKYPSGNEPDPADSPYFGPVPF